MIFSVLGLEAFFEPQAKNLGVFKIGPKSKVIQKYHLAAFNKFQSKSLKHSVV